MNNNLFRLDSDGALFERKSFRILLLIGFVVALPASFIFWNMYGAPLQSEHSAKEVPDTQPVAPVEEKGTTYPERIFTGVLMSIGPDATFVRVSVKDEGVYSVALTPETKITMNGADTDIRALAPMSVVSITSSVLPDTEPYDFSALSIVGGSEVSPSDSVTATSVSTGAPESGKSSEDTSTQNATNQGLHTQEKLEQLIKESSEAGMFKR